MTREEREKLFEQYTKEVLEKNEVDPLWYHYYSDSIDFECYIVREALKKFGEELVKSVEVVLKNFRK